MIDLEAIKARLARMSQGSDDRAGLGYVADVGALLAEVNRLRKELEQNRRITFEAQRLAMEQLGNVDRTNESMAAAVVRLGRFSLNCVRGGACGKKEEPVVPSDEP